MNMGILNYIYSETSQTIIIAIQNQWCIIYD